MKVQNEIHTRIELVLNYESEKGYTPLWRHGIRDGRRPVEAPPALEVATRPGIGIAYTL